MGVDGTEGKRLLEALGFFINGGASLGLASGLGGGSKTPWRGDKVPCRARMGAGESRKRAPLVREETAGVSPPNLAFLGGSRQRQEKGGCPRPALAGPRAPTHPRPSCSMVRRRSETGESSS